MNDPGLRPGVVVRVVCDQQFGRLPWFGPVFLRSRRLRARFDMGVLLNGLVVYRLFSVTRAVVE
jgi:hypothetical protein